MRSVEELTKDELNELRGRWYSERVDDGSIDEVMGFEVEQEEQVPMDVVKAAYEGTMFVDEDFFCNSDKEVVEKIRKKLITKTSFIMFYIVYLKILKSDIDFEGTLEELKELVLKAFPGEEEGIVFKM